MSIFQKLRWPIQNGGIYFFAGKSSTLRKRFIEQKVLRINQKNTCEFSQNVDTFLDFSKNCKIQKFKNVSKILQKFIPILWLILRVFCSIKFSIKLILFMQNITEYSIIPNYINHHFYHVIKTIIFTFTWWELETVVYWLEGYWLMGFRQYRN